MSVPDRPPAARVRDAAGVERLRRSLDAKGRTRLKQITTPSRPCPATGDGHADELEDALATRLDDGAEVIVGFHDEQLLKMFGRRMWLVRMRIVEGEQLPDPSAFARRLATLLERGLPQAA